jgi:hypothetical protein
MSKAPWIVDRETFTKATAAAAADRFSDAFKRWRQLYEGARAQLLEANRKSEMNGLSAKERKDAKVEQAQANEQLALLEKGRATGGSDFYTYRYLATEGFLPGYNFPRLPLYAYVPAVGAGVLKLHTCNVPGFSPSPNSDQVALFTMRAEDTVCIRLSYHLGSAPKMEDVLPQLRYLSAMNAAGHMKRSLNVVTLAVAA